MVNHFNCGAEHDTIQIEYSKAMKKAKAEKADDLRDQLKAGDQGKHADRFREGTNLTVS